MNVTLYIDGHSVTLENISHKSQEITFKHNGRAWHFRSRRQADGGFLLEREVTTDVWQSLRGLVWQSGKERRVQVGGAEAKVREIAADATHASGQTELSPPAPMPGLVRQILVKKGEHVVQGQALAVMEAMKLQITLSAGGDAMVGAVLVKEGDMVSEGAVLVHLVAVESKA